MSTESAARKAAARFLCATFALFLLLSVRAYARSADGTRYDIGGIYHLAQLQIYESSVESKADECNRLQKNHDALIFMIAAGIGGALLNFYCLRNMYSSDHFWGYAIVFLVVLVGLGYCFVMCLQIIVNGK